ncbi:MAG TPA: hypothetical protein VFM70_10600 [Salinimicrobium sp.]|nr:hypothetical protein [Salinimicrobium sp.]
MKKILFLLLMLLLVSCNGSKTLISANMNEEEIQEILLFTPVFTETKGKYQEAQDRSEIRINEMSDSIFYLHPEYKISKKAHLTATQKNELLTELLNIEKRIQEANSLDNIEVPAIIRKYLSDQNLKYGYIDLCDADYTTFESYLKMKINADIIIHAGDGDAIVSYKIILSGFIFNQETNSLVKYHREKHKTKGVHIIQEFIQNMFKS